MTVHTWNIALDCTGEIIVKYEVLKTKFFHFLLFI